MKSLLLKLLLFIYPLFIFIRKLLEISNSVLAVSNSPAKLLKQQVMINSMSQQTGSFNRELTSVENTQMFNNNFQVGVFFIKNG